MEHVNGASGVALDEFPGHGPALTRLGAGPRDLKAVVTAMIAAVPEGDDLAGMLTGAMGTYELFGCAEMEEDMWKNIMMAMMKRVETFQRFEKLKQLPQWFLHVCAIFRGVAE